MKSFGGEIGHQFILAKQPFFPVKLDNFTIPMSFNKIALCVIHELLYN